MKSSAKRMRWFMITLFIVLMAVCVGLSSVFMACSNDKNKDGDTGEEQGQETPEGGTGEGTGEGNDDTITPYLTLSDSTLNLTIGGEYGEDTATISVTSMTLADKTVVEDLTGYTVTWSSSNNNIATVDAGVVTAKGEGSCTITATIDSVIGECAVTVKDETPLFDDPDLTRVEKVEATCTEAGHITYYTDEEGAIYFDGLGLREMTEEDIVIPAGHVLSRIKAVAATCGTDGNVEYWHCSACGKDFSDAAGTTAIDSVLDSASGNHTYSTTVYNSDSTNHWFACEVCGDIQSSSVAAHSYGSWTEDTANSNCDQTVYTETCDDCGYVNTYVATGTGSHSFDNATEYVIMTVPTESSTGYAAPKCTVCGATSGDNSNWMTLPEISETNYTIEENAEDGSITYTYSDSDTGVEISFKAEWVVTEFDFEEAADQYGDGSSYGLTNGATIGKFTFAAGKIYFEKSNKDVNTQGCTISVTLTGEVNYISFNIKGASSSGCTPSIENEAGQVLWSNAALGSGTALEGGVKLENLPAGTYYIKTQNAGRISDLEIGEYIVGQASVTGISATIENSQFVYGTKITTDDLGLNVTLAYDNGKTEAVTTGISTDIEDVTLNIGKNIITVTYDDNAGGQRTCEVEVYIYKVYDIYLSDVAMEYTGGTYYTHNAQRIYLVGDTVNTDYITVTAQAACGVTGMPTMEFILDAGDYTFDTSAVDMSRAGTYTITVKGNMNQTDGDVKTATYTIDVIEIDSNVQRAVINVDQTAEVGEDAESGIITVNRINDAVKLLELLGVTNAERKYIYVGEGEYWEKVEIDMPNVSIIGSNTTAGGVKGTQTVIVYDAMNGVTDPSGTTTFSTVGSATFTVASSATGFYAANITFRNYWNTNELYNESLKITSSTQADAAYVNADKVIFNNVTFTGYHDTLEAENGRQLYYQCYIEGRTDFIFGNTATAYFYQCTIHSIGAGTSQNNGGYVVATKGGTASAHVDYGYIFNGCNFEGDANVKEGSVSIARGWDTYMTIMVINSTLDKSFSTEGYGNSSSSLNDRYTSMNAAPIASQLFEYHNVGDGAINVDGSHYIKRSGVVYEVVNGTEYPLFTLLSAEDAAKYEDFGVVFGKTNGSYSYSDDWDLAFDIITITVESSAGTVTTICATNSISVSDLVDAINVRILNGEVEGIFSDVELTTELTGTLYADTTVYISVMEKDMSVKETTMWEFTSGAYGDSVTVSGYLDDNEKLYLDCGDNGALTKNNTYYKLDNGASLKLILKKGSILGVGVYANNGFLTVTDENGTEVTGTYSATSTHNNYAFTYTAEADGTYTISQSASATDTVYLIYINVAIPVTESTTISFAGKTYAASYEGDYGWFEYVYTDATTGKFTVRTSNNDVQVGEGCVIYVQSVPGATATLNFNSGYSCEYTPETDENGLITITIGTQTQSGIYISEIVVTVPTAVEIGTTFDFTNAVGLAIEGSIGNYEGISIDATSGKFTYNGTDCVQVNSGTVLTIWSVAGATAEITYYPGQAPTEEGTLTSIVTDENGVITITFNANTYVTAITIVADTAED